MPEKLGSRLVHAWNAFRARDETDNEEFYIPPITGAGYNTNPSRPTFRKGNEKTIITSIYNKIALDVASYDIHHVKTDKDGVYVETVEDGLNHCLTTSANKDQTGRALLHDIVVSMFDEGSVAVVPVETTFNPKKTSSYDILSLRAGRIVDFYPDHVRVELYNDQTGMKQQSILPKNICAIIENPFYAVMNEKNSTMQRLIHKLALLDAVDTQNSSGKLDIIIQLPYTVRSEAVSNRAEQRVRSLEKQLSQNKYGVAYSDATEKITQLNRPVENNLLTQIQYLNQMLYNQIGVSEAVFDGSATEQVLRNYYDRTVEPIVHVITDEMRRKFLTKTSRTQGHSIQGYRNIFKLVPANELAEVADVLSRNEILTPNEIRGIMGYKPSTDKAADELTNRNMPAQYGRTYKPSKTKEEDLIEDEDKKV